MAPCEWVIDIIKEWVIAQTYATMTWVIDWVTPVHITGPLDPNATCTYHKGGTLNNKTWYVRTDGAWFLWWSTLERWFISETLGVEAGPRWVRNTPDVYGGYISIAPASGLATVTSGYGCPHYCFVDRGDPASVDYDIDDLTRDSNWHELDISAIVPYGATCILFTLTVRATVAGNHFIIRDADNVNGVNTSGVRTQVANIRKKADLSCPCSANRKIDYFLTAGNWNLIFLTVKGWWF